MLNLSTLAIVVAALAQARDAVQSMAAWQVGAGLVWMHRTVVFALPETVIALFKGPKSAQSLRFFCSMVGLASSGILLLLWATGLDFAFFRSWLGAKAETSELAHLTVILCLLLPLIGALQSFSRGALAATHRTMPRLAAMVVGMVALLAGLGIGLNLKWPGVLVAASATTAGLLAEWILLALSSAKAISALDPAAS
jgi:hypothetical protein